MSEEEAVLLTDRGRIGRLCTPCGDLVRTYDGEVGVSTLDAVQLWSRDRTEGTAGGVGA